jgi:hypothetical protein
LAILGKKPGLQPPLEMLAFTLRLFSVYWLRAKNMRLVKLSTTEFKDEVDLHDYFFGVLPKRNPKGLFVFNDHIAANGLDPGETILFSYKNKLRYVTKTKTSRTDNTSRNKGKYSYCFEIELPVREADVSLEEVERKLQAKAGLKKSLLGQGWTKILDKRAEKIIEDLLLADAPTPSANDVDVPDELPAKIKQTVSRIIRDTKISRQIKKLYEFRCQVCRERLGIPFYAEAHHLQPLGDKGPDVQDNILCLCPNHHTLFDYFAIPLDPAKLHLNKHNLRQSFVDYHNAHFRLQTAGQ